MNFLCGSLVLCSYTGLYAAHSTVAEAVQLATITQSATSSTASDCANGGVSCEVDGYGAVAAGPYDPYFWTGLSQARPQGIGTVSIVIDHYSKTTAFRSEGSCITTEETPVTFSTPYTFSTVGANVTFGDEVLAAAGSTIGQRLGLATCVFVIRNSNILPITNTASASLHYPTINTASSTKRSDTKASGTLTVPTARQTSTSKATISGSATPQAALNPAPEAKSHSSKKRLALLLGLVLPLLALTVLATWFLLWRKRRKLSGRPLSKASNPEHLLPYHQTTESHAEHPECAECVSRTHKWIGKPSEGFRYELDDGRHDGVVQPKHEILISIPVQELRGTDTSHEMEA